MKLTIGCTTRLYSTCSFEEACAHIAAAGYTDVAVFRNQQALPVTAESTPDEVAAARQAAADAGLTPSMLIGRTNLGLGVDAAVADYKKLIDNAAALGAKWLLDCGTSNEAHYDSYLELMRQCAPHAGDAGLKITMKPHGGISLTADHLKHAHQAVGHPAFGICYDPGNIIYYTKGERRPETDVGAVAALVSTCIIKDCVVNDDKADVMVTPGSGLVDFPAVLRRLIGAGFNGPLYVECVGGKDVDAVDRDATHTLGYVRGILDTI
jgi:sugar phosphate isomerase/epimerase